MISTYVSFLLLSIVYSKSNIPPVAHKLAIRSLYMLIFICAWYIYLLIWTKTKKGTTEPKQDIVIPQPDGFSIYGWMASVIHTIAPLIHYISEAGKVKNIFISLYMVSGMTVLALAVFPFRSDHDITKGASVGFRTLLLVSVWYAYMANTGWFRLCLIVLSIVRTNVVFMGLNFAFYGALRVYQCWAEGCFANDSEGEGGEYGTLLSSNPTGLSSSILEEEEEVGEDDPGEEDKEQGLELSKMDTDESEDGSEEEEEEEEEASSSSDEDVEETSAFISPPQPSMPDRYRSRRQRQRENKTRYSPAFHNPPPAWTDPEC